MRRAALLLLIALSCATMHAPETYRVRFETTQGTFVVEVQRALAPHGADRFYELVRSGFYDDSRIFRVRAGFIAQFGIAGDPAVEARWQSKTIPDDPVRASNVRGTIAYAMTAPHTRATQVYINLGDNSRLDAQGFAPFGRVIEGMDVVDRFYSGYGEAAGGGMRGGKQEPVMRGGNRYLDQAFPRLDHIATATLTGFGVRASRFGK